jgi:hypothetical protein
VPAATTSETEDTMQTSFQVGTSLVLNTVPISGMAGCLDIASVN